ncbi:hypothetical protein Tco_1572371, partial [Tanacetum coccineum]
MSKQRTLAAVVVSVGEDGEGDGAVEMEVVAGSWCRGDEGDVRMMYGEVVWRRRRWCVGCWPELGWPEILPEKMGAPENLREGGD